MRERVKVLTTVVDIEGVLVVHLVEEVGGGKDIIVVDLPIDDVG
jgi:hypothetical protein